MLVTGWRTMPAKRGRDMARVLNAPVAYQSCVIVRNEIDNKMRLCLICQQPFMVGDEMVLFDKNHTVSHVTAMHGFCVKTLAQYFVPDHELAKQFDEYRVKLLNRYER